jgi:hypothetical protein
MEKLGKCQIFLWVRARHFSRVRNLTDATDSTMPNEHAIYSVEYGKITHKKIISTCRRVFNAVDDKMYITQEDTGKQIQVRALMFNKITVDSQGKAYEIIDSIKILDLAGEDSDSDEQNDDGDNHKTERRKYDQKTNTSNNDENKQSNSQPEGRDDLSNNNDLDGDNEEDIQDSSTNISNISSDGEGANLVDSEDTKDSTYTRTAQISVLQSCNSDPDLAKVGERLNNLRQAVDSRDKAWKRKASEAAEANKSGVSS